jgi:flavin reductase (DIM6/NTAB) family NADH-FMN oxidoreductase RutF
VGGRLEEVAYGTFGSKSGRAIDKFAESKVKIKKGEKIKAPVLEGFIVVLECKPTKTCEAGDHISSYRRSCECY